MESSSFPNKRETRRPRKPKSICLPVEREAYQVCLEDPVYCRHYIVGTKHSRAKMELSLPA